MFYSPEPIGLQSAPLIKLHVYRVLDSSFFLGDMYVNKTTQTTCEHLNDRKLNKTYRIIVLLRAGEGINDNLRQ